MKTETYVTLERDEVNSVLNYQLIASCVGGSSWNTGNINREKSRTFTPTEMDMIQKIYKKSHKWYLVTGVPEEVTMTLIEFNMWKKLKDFCVKNMTLYGKGNTNV